MQVIILLLLLLVPSGRLVICISIGGTVDMLYLGGSIRHIILLLLLLVPLGRLVIYISIWDTVDMGVKLYLGGSINLGSITGSLGRGKFFVS